MVNRQRWIGLVSGATIALALGGCAGFDISGGVASADDRATRLIRMGDYTMTHGDRVTAIALYEQALMADPNSADALARLGALQQASGASVSAIDSFRQAVERAPDDPAALRRLGNALLEQTEPEQALVHLERSLALAESSLTRNSLGVAYDLIGQHAPAQQHYRAGMVDAPNDLALGNNLALSMALDGSFDAAIALASEISASATATSRHRQTFALILGLAGQPDRAVEVARIDLAAADVESNLAYYEMLRSVEPSSARALAINGVLNAPSQQVGFLIDVAGGQTQVVQVAVRFGSR